MAYFIFDMDETLAELYSVYYFVASLQDEIDEPMPADMTIKKKRAYQYFVKGILKKEKAKNESGESMPLGILRPGILQIMTKLYELQKQDKIKNVIIYSNNGHLESLHFIRDLIHTNLGTKDLIKECIHWHHHMRGDERIIKPGVSNKTWNVLKNIMINGNCKAPSTIKPSDVYFFDDLNHLDLQKHLGKNYFKVPAYTYKASFDKIAEVYTKSLQLAKVDINGFKHNVIDLFVNTDNDMNLIMNANGLDGILAFFRSNTKGTSLETPPPSVDEGIKIMEEAIETIEMKGGNRKIKFSIKKRRKCGHRGCTRVKKLKRSE